MFRIVGPYDLPPTKLRMSRPALSWRRVCAICREIEDGRNIFLPALASVIQPSPKIVLEEIHGKVKENTAWNEFFLKIKFTDIDIFKDLLQHVGGWPTWLSKLSRGYCPASVACFYARTWFPSPKILLINVKSLLNTNLSRFGVTKTTNVMLVFAALIFFYLPFLRWYFHDYKKRKKKYFARLFRHFISSKIWVFSDSRQF